MMVGGVAAQLARVESDESMHASRTSHILSAIDTGREIAQPVSASVRAMISRCDRRKGCR